jgi:glycerol transport system ATP-binding protein
VRVSHDGEIPLDIRAVESIGRYKIVRSHLAGHPLNALLRDTAEIPALPRASFDPVHVNIYSDARLVEPEAA